MQHMEPKPAVESRMQGEGRVTKGVCMQTSGSRGWWQGRSRVFRSSYCLEQPCQQQPCQHTVWLYARLKGANWALRIPSRILTCVPFTASSSLFISSGDPLGTRAKMSIKCSNPGRLDCQNSDPLPSLAHTLCAICSS